MKSAIFYFPPAAGLFLLTVPCVHAGTGGGDGKAPGAVPPAPPLAEVQDRWHFRVSAGAGYRSIGDVEFNTGSRSGGLRLPFLATALGRRHSTVGSATEYADRQYRDGYVNQDGGTANDGSTWFWGYENAGQLTGDDGGSLQFQGAGDSFTRNSNRSSDRDPGSWQTDGDGGVPVIQIDVEYDFHPRWSAGASLQYSFLGFDGSQDSSGFSAFQQQTSQAVNVTDRYVLDGVQVPESPYAGSLEGPGPLILNRPTSRDFGNGGVFDRSGVQFFNRIHETLDVKLHRLAFGPTLTGRLGRVDLSLGSGLSLNIADWSASHTETLYVRKDGGPARTYRRWADRASGTEVLPGIFVQTAARVALTSRISFTGFGSFDWSRSLTEEVGPSHFSVDPGGWTVGGMFGYTF